MLRAWGSRRAWLFVAWLPCLENCRYLREMPLFAAYGRSSLARSRRWLEMAARARPGAAECSTGADRVCPGTAECSTGAARATLEAQNGRRVPLEPALEPQHARKVPLEPTAVRCVRFVRSKSAVSCSSVIGINFCSAPPCFVHVMHGFTLVYIYIYIYTYIYISM